MDENEKIDVEPTEPLSHPTEGKKSRSALSKLRRDLSEDEISSPGALKLLLDKLDQLEIQVSELEDYRDKFYTADKNVAVLETRITKNTGFEILYGFSLSTGAIFCGLAPTAWKSQPFGWLSLLLGISLMGGAILFKARTK